MRNCSIMMIGILVFLGQFFSILPASGADTDSVSDLTELSIEELMDVEVTLTARKPQKLSAAAAAAFVITGEDIRRSGVTSIPEALRMVPGFQVARIDANKWAVSSRGFNGRYAYKLLVLIDGRTVYSPIFSGVFWEAQDVLLEDIERIEVIRGPGASLWGSNAVNGVINIVTKHSQDTIGTMLFAGAGNEERGFGGVRYGDRLNERFTYRIHAKYSDRDESEDAAGNGLSDDWHLFSSGFRADGALSEKDDMSFHANAYSGEKSQMAHLPTLTPPYSELYDEDEDMSGVNLLGRWQHRFSEDSDINLQIFFDHTETDESAVVLKEDIWDIDFQHRFALGKRQEILWGLGYRFYRDTSTSSFSSGLDPHKLYYLLSGFIQDEIVLIKDRLRLTLGSRFENNDYTDFEIQPNARILWTPHQKHSFWAAVSRTVKTPTRASDDARLVMQIIPPGTSVNPAQVPLAVTVFGSRNAVSEKLVALELGYRLNPVDRFSCSLSGFYNFYDDLATAYMSEPYSEMSPLPHVVVPYHVTTRLEGETYGLELSAHWQPLTWETVQAAYTYFQTAINADEDLSLGTGMTREGNAPVHQLSLRFSTDLPHNLECDLWFRYVDEILGGKVDDYFTADIRLGWKPLKNMEVSLVGKNLTEQRRAEFIESFLRTPSGEVERSVYAKISWHF